MQLVFKSFYTQYGVRRPQSMFSPKLVNLVDLPMNSIIHYLTSDTELPDIDPSKLYFQQNKNLVYVDVIEELSDNKGNPRRKPGVIKNMVRPFFIKNKKFRYLKDPQKSINSKQILLAVNYNYLDHAYSYVNIPANEYNKFWNKYKTMWDHINVAANESDRNHFVFLDIPQQLPSYSFLRMYSDKVNLALLKIFDTDSKLMILELWKWLSGDFRDKSVMANVSVENLNKINLVLTTTDNVSTIINLGYLNSWIKGAKNLTDMPSVSQFPTDTIQKLFLKLLLTLHDSVKEQETVDTETDVAPEPVKALGVQDEEPSEEEAEEGEETYSEQAIREAKQWMPSDKQGEIYEAVDEEQIEKDEVADIFKEMDEELAALDILNTKALKEKGIKISSKGEIEQAVEVEKLKELSQQELKDIIYSSPSNEDALLGQLESYADYGILSASDYKKLIKDANAYKTLKDPYGSKQTILEAKVITPKDLELDEEKSTIVASENVLDKNMLKSSLLSFKEDYINNVLNKDVLNMVSDIQRAGVIIKNHEVEDDVSALGHYQIHTLDLKPIDGSPSTIRFRLPKIDDDGNFVAGGNKYGMRLQRVDLPIRKIDENTVALTTYYGKNFVTRSRKKSDSYVSWIVNQITKANLIEHPYITKVAPGQVFSNRVKAPYIYSALASAFKLIKAGKYTLMFSYEDRNTIGVPEALIPTLEQNGKVLVGITDSNNPVVVDTDNNFHIYQNDQFTPIGDIFNVLQLNQQAAPVDFVEVRVFSKTVPVGLVLCYFLGFKNVLKLLDAKYRVVEGRRVKDLLDYEFPITFKNETYVFSRKNESVSLIVAGLLEYEKQIKLYDSELFDSKDIYLNLLTSKGLGSLYIRELELSDQMFVDSITKSILEGMGEPTTFKGLLVRATELLKEYYHPDPQDMDYMRIRGYERLSGFVYKDLTAAIRQFKNRNISGKSKIEMSPYQVWSDIMSDPSIKLPEDTNPIQNLKESEVVTYVGEGGRSKQTMTKPTRSYHANDMGVISESTVDSGDVGINAYLSPNPNFKNLRGLVKENKDLNMSTLLSTSANLAVGADSDDSKRVNFIAIQQAHTVNAQGYHQPVVRTGYENVIGNRTSEMFSYTAKSSGKVISKNKTGIIIEYEDGTKKGIPIGRIYGKAEGSVYPHDIVTPLSVGDTFKKGDMVVYNTSFFEPDFLDPKSAVMKNSMLVKTVLWESNQTLEDSSSISPELSKKLTTRTTKIKSLTVDFTQNLLNVVKVGQNVHPKDIFMLIEDPITSTTKYFDEESLSVLRKLSKQAPSSKYEGVIDRIEVFYHGSKEDMSSSLRVLADQSDKLMADIAKSSNQPVITGKVNDDYRVGGTPLSLDRAEIKIYITIETPAGVGD